MDSNRAVTVRNITNQDEEPVAYLGVMVSSTFLDLSEHRKVLLEALSKNKLLAIAMEHYTLQPDDTVFASSIRMVRESSSYIGLIGHRYGAVPDVTENPNGYSITRIEFDEAQRLNRPTLVFVMGGEHPVKAIDVELDTEKRKRLEEFRERAKAGRIYAEFNNLEEFRQIAADAVANLRQHLANRPTSISLNVNSANSPFSRSLSTDLESHNILDTLAPNVRYASANVAWFRSLVREEITASLPPELTDDEFLTRLGVFFHGTLTKTGGLLFSDRASSVISSAVTRVTKYEGDSNKEASIRNNLEGCVIRQIVDARDFVDKHTQHRESKSGDSSFTEKLSQYPMKCVREVIANAICHRDYTDEHRMAYVRIFDSFIEVSNSGYWNRLNRSPNPIPLSKLVGQPVSNNMTLAKAISSVNLVEMEGSGLQTAIADCESIEAPEPTARYSDGYIIVRIYPRRNWSGNAQVIVSLNVDGYSKGIERHLAFIKKWSSIISIADLQAPKDMGSSYVELKYSPIARRFRLHGEQVHSLSLESMIEKSGTGIILLGSPGSGKTTTSKILAHRLANTEAGDAKIPIVIRLREIESQKSKFQNQRLIVHIASVIGLSFTADNKLMSETELGSSQIANISELRQSIMEFINSVGATLILDGLDEMNESNQSDLISEIEQLTPLMHKGKVFVTCRTGAIMYQPEGFAIYEIVPLSTAQIKQFVSKWLGHKFASRFIAELQHNPTISQAQTSPLFLSQLIAIFQRIGYLPRYSKTLTKKMLIMLLEEWDQQRAIHRSSRYGEFSTFQKYEFLCALAYQLTQENKVPMFTRGELSNAYSSIRETFHLPEHEADAVAGEIEAHTGILIKTGFDSYEFSTKLFQEHLCAEYILKLPILLGRIELRRFPNELAISTSLSSNPDTFLHKIMGLILETNEVDVITVNTFFSRLILEKPALYKCEKSLLIALLQLNTKLLVSEVNSIGQITPIEKFILDNKFAEQVATLIDNLPTGESRLEEYGISDITIMKRYIILWLNELERENLPKLLLINKALQENTFKS